MDVSPQSYPDLPNPSNCLCINPKCKNYKRHSNEKYCQNCGFELLLKQRYKVIDFLKSNQRQNIKNKESILYDAIDIKDRKPKVIKVLYTENTDAIDRFKLGAKVLRGHWFKGIPQVDQEGYFTLDFPSDPNFPSDPRTALCLVMEKIEGMDLHEWLEDKNYKTIDEEQAIDWLEQLANILCKLHQEKYYHRDIKPSNIMLRTHTNELVLIDLDTVRAITAASEQGKDVTRIGTPGYQAPEQEDGKAVPQSDFYALGRTFVHLLTGKHPEKLRNRSGKLNWRVHASQLQVFGSFASLIDKLMAFSPEDRPKDAQEILQRLKEIKQQLKIQKQVQNLFSLNWLNQWLTFKKVFGSIVMLTVAVVGYKAIQPKNPEQVVNPPTSTPTFDSRCKLVSGNPPKQDDDKLAKEIKDFLQLTIATTKAFQKLKLHDVRQTNCNVIIIVKTSNNNDIDMKIQDEIKNKIKTEFNYVDKITISSQQ